MDDSEIRIRKDRLEKDLADLGKFGEVAGGGRGGARCRHKGAQQVCRCRFRAQPGATKGFTRCRAGIASSTPGRFPGDGAVATWPGHRSRPVPLGM